VSWIRDIVSPKARAWEEFYRNRWQHDKVVRSTHGVNCTGGCSWDIHVKQGIVTWEMQALDYPRLQDDIPPYEPRGCQRGISFSWYLYSPIRVKYPYMRGALLDLWREARRRFDDPVEAWADLVSDPERRSRYQRARGKGGFRRVTWEEVNELIAASNVHTIKKYGADRIFGFSPIPAMSFLSYASGSRYLQLMGGVNLSFYDWYCDLPPASPEIWGEQTDVAESADWYNAKFIASVGSNMSMTRTPDCHFAAEARHNGTKLVVFAPDFSQVSKYADQWIPIHAGQDAAFWLATNHVILKEFHHDRRVDYFQGYLKRYTDTPFLIELTEGAGTPGASPSGSDGGAGRKGWTAGQMLRAGRMKRYDDEENGEWKFLIWDTGSNEPRAPGGTVGHRWGEQKGRWNLKLEDPTDGSPLEPELSFLEVNDAVLQVEVPDFGGGRSMLRGVPVRYVTTADGARVPVTTVFDMLMAQYAVPRGLEGDYPEDYDDETAPYTPAWQEQWTGINREMVIRFAREWASTAEKTEGRCMVIIGAGVNHWYHNNLIYRSAINALMLCGCVGRNGGGLNHYVGQEKLAPMPAWSSLALSKDWGAPPRLQNTPSWHYMHSDQWRYDRPFAQYAAVPDNPLTRGHTADMEVRAVRSGWLPFYPQFDESNTDVIKAAQESGAESGEQVVANVVERLKSGDLKFAVEDPDAESNWPRIFFIWRGNALMSSAKGHEFFLKHYLGTHHNEIAAEEAKGTVEDVAWHEEAPTGKMDLIIDLNFRMDTSALYSDIVLPAATWYEKDDLNSTDLHSFIHPLSEAVPPVWESKSDWDIFRGLARTFSELARRHFPEPLTDLVAAPLAHDSPAEMAQRHIVDWKQGDTEAVPGKTMPKLVLVERDLPNLYNRFISYGPKVRDTGLGAHANQYAVDDIYDDIVEREALPLERWGGETYPSLKDARDAANIILAFASETNGELACRGYEHLERETGLTLLDLAEPNRGVRMTFDDLQAQPRRLLTSPTWSGLMQDGRPYAAFTGNVERLIPWRTLTGRQHFYLDHEGYIAFGENLPVYKPCPSPEEFGDLVTTETGERQIRLNFLTPHGKWQIHSTYSDNHRMMTLSRGIETFWMNDRDASELGIVDNDWVEVHNDNGVVVTRCNVSARIPRGVGLQYHSPERTLGVPKSPLRGNRRAGGHNSLTRIRLKPNLMVGGYGQFTYHFNYWGPTGVNRDTYVMVRRLDSVEL
jgi:nitrate reductase alpha subunit